MRLRCGVGSTSMVCESNIICKVGSGKRRDVITDEVTE